MRNILSSGENVRLKYLIKKKNASKSKPSSKLTSILQIKNAIKLNTSNQKKTDCKIKSDAKLVRRPIMWTAIIVTGAVMIIANIYFDVHELPAKETENGQIEGKITGKEIKNGKTYIMLKNINVISGCETVKEIRESNLIYKKLGAVCVLNEGEELPKIGERVIITGKISLYDKATNPGQFDVRRYYISCGYLLNARDCIVRDRKGEANIFKEACFSARTFMLKKLDEALDAKDAGIMKAILLADKTTLDNDVKTMYQEAGAGHILAISGLHISLIANAVLSIAIYLPIPLWAGYSSSALVLILYGFIIGFTPSALRAIIMFSIKIIGKIIGRSYDGLTSLAVAALITVMIKPLATLQEGFMMSYLAIIGMAIVSPAFVPFKHKAKKFLVGIVSGVGVNLITLPIVVNSYYYFSPYGILVNLIIVPGMSILIPLGAACIAWQSLFAKQYNIFAFMIHLCLKIYEFLVHTELLLPGSTVITGSRSTLKSLTYIVVLLLAATVLKQYKKTAYIRRKLLVNHVRRNPEAKTLGIRKRDKKKLKKAYIITALVLVADLTFFFCKKEEDMVEFLDVGQGLCVCIHCDNRLYFFDGGSSDKNNIGKYILTPYIRYYGHESVEIWFVSHADSDHVSGITEILEAGDIDVKKIVLPETLYDTFEGKIGGENIYLVSKGDCIQNESVKFLVCSPQKESLQNEKLGQKSRSSKNVNDENECSLVILANIDSKNILLMADAGKMGENNVFDYLSQGEKTDVFQVAHHGSAVGCNSYDFIKDVNPKISVISCGLNNVYNHPHVETMKNLLEAGTQIYRTDRDGAIRIYMKHL